MEKKRYFVTLQTGTQTAEIREAIDNTDSAYDFEIEATESQVYEMRKMLQEAYTVDFDSFLHGHILFADLPEDDNKTHDSILQDIYRMIYQCGTPETRKKMEQDGLVELFRLDQEPLNIS